MASRKRIVPKKLGEVLIERGLISHDQLDDALRIQKKDGRLLGAILVEMKHVTEESIAWAVSIQYGLAYLCLTSYEMNPEIITQIPKEIAEKHMLVAIDKIGNVLTVAMSNPLDGSAVTDVEKQTGCVVRPFISTFSEIAGAIQNAYK